MQSYQSRIKTEEIDSFFEVILLLKDEAECYQFFEDICTISELHAIAQRLEVAKLLKQNVTYQEIAQRLGASTATISRVNRCLTYGSGGYRTMLQRLEKTQQPEND